MIRRVALSIQDEKLRARLRRQLRDDHLVLLDAPIASWREALSQETIDLAIVALDEATSRPEPPEAPANFDVLLLAPGADAQRDARLVAHGYVGVLSWELPDALLGDAIRAMLKQRGRGPASYRSAHTSVELRLDNFVSQSPVMGEFMAVVRRLVATDASLLITGETGVGKERLARAIHNESRRRTGPFVALNCAALTETLLESELFGHEAGAFTGAVRARRGLFELAHEGTILLDEVGDMPPHLQAKLLQVLQNREFFRVGGESPIRVDVRVMAATNRDLLAEVQAGRFRRDLFYRLGVVAVNVPPLRERREDIRCLVAETAATLHWQSPHAPQDFDEAALAALEAYDWPGNVRELINVVERILLLASGQRITLMDVADITHVPPPDLNDLPPLPTFLADASPPGEAYSRLSASLKEVRRQHLERVEYEYLTAILRETEGKIGEAAQRAQVHPRWLNEKMRRFGLKKEDFRPGGRKHKPPS